MVRTALAGSTRACLSPSRTPKTIWRRFTHHYYITSDTTTRITDLTTPSLQTARGGKGIPITTSVLHVYRPTHTTAMGLLLVNLDFQRLETESESLKGPSASPELPNSTGRANTWPMSRLNGWLFKVFCTLTFLPRSPAQLSHLTETWRRCPTVWQRCR